MSGANPDLPRLFHHLNNQLGVILANAELLERRLGDEHRARAEQVVSGALEAIETARRIRLALSAE
jgi:adenylate kinase